MFLIELLALGSLVACATEKHTVQPSAGFVPDKETAISIAVAVWTPIYGKEKIAKQKPYKAKLINDIWIVNGSLKQKKGFITLGGVAIAEISKCDGKIIRVYHSK